MLKITHTAAMIGPMPIFTILRNENSKPSVNMMKMTPISDHVWILCVSLTEGIYDMCGPVKKPAKI